MICRVPKYLWGYVVFLAFFQLHATIEDFKSPAEMNKYDLAPRPWFVLPDVGGVFK